MRWGTTREYRVTKVFAFAIVSLICCYSWPSPTLLAPPATLHVLPRCPPMIPSTFCAEHRGAACSQSLPAACLLVRPPPPLPPAPRPPSVPVCAIRRTGACMHRLGYWPLPHLHTVGACSKAAKGFRAVRPRPPEMHVCGHSARIFCQIRAFWDHA
jgi:hypothetical protein